MRRYLPLLNMIIFLFFVSCQTFEEQIDPIDYEAAPAPDEPIQQSGELPLPSYEIAFFSYPHRMNETIVVPVSPSLPQYSEPVPESEPEPENSEPVVNSEPLLPESLGETVLDDDTSLVEVLASTVVEDAAKSELSRSESQPEPDLIREEWYAPGVTAIIVLEGSDWVFLGEEELQDAGFADRQALADRTLFTFQFPREGTYSLLFLRQNHSTGDSEEARIFVHADAAILPEEEVLSVEIIEETPLVEQENPDSEVTSAAINLSSSSDVEKRLELIEDDPEQVEETIEILEYLVNVESDDESLAEYYYRLARTLEKNSQFQDLRRAYETYQYIEANFFLTDYYEKAEERIRYLDRHFFKLR